MSKRQDYNNSYDLEKLLSRSIDSMAENITRQHKLRREIIKLRKQRRAIQTVPEEVREWFEETEGLEDEDET